ncbi:hypothetical protein [Pseudomonas salomonii]|uniref:Uncharacterized protein n=1 Tax=Pseudomonas salomonii TaxID=191391 RepID=A0A1H3C1U2_9PSED|nr:hypothetical protein [Pseudomonas salomonii]SDX48035.1 hypothetical protein SAMN05216247_101144 [Pseudomonas salomonii]
MPAITDPHTGLISFQKALLSGTIKPKRCKDGSSYRAYGDFRGERIDVRSTTQSGAESKWREKANHKANE